MRERDVYEIWSQDGKQVYVGLSVNSKKRAGQHKYSKTAGGLLNSGGTMKTVASALQQSDAVEMERDLIAKYRNDPRVKCLNRRAGGQLGSDGGLVWTKEKVYEIAKGCRSRSEFYYKNGSAYHAARRDAYFDELCEEFGIAESIHSLTGDRYNQLKKKYDECRTIFDLSESNRKTIRNRGLWKEFAGIDIIYSDSIPDDLERRLRWRSPPGDPYQYMGYGGSRKFKKFGQSYDFDSKVRIAQARYLCKLAGIIFAEKPHVTLTVESWFIPRGRISCRRYASIEDFTKNPDNFLLVDESSLYDDIGYDGYRALRRRITYLRSKTPREIDDAIIRGDLPIPERRTDNGAMFPVDALVNWARNRKLDEWER